MTDQVLTEAFKTHYASVTSAKVVFDRDTGRSKCFGFVRFGDTQEQKRAIVEMNGSWISTRQIRWRPPGAKEPCNSQKSRAYEPC